MSPALVQGHRVFNGHSDYMVALLAFKGPQIGMGGTRFDVGQHHAAMTLGAAGPFDRQERGFGADRGFWHAMLPCIGREHAALSSHRWMPKDGAVIVRAYTGSTATRCNG